MPERCTCGAQLPEDALFCHKCGKPQREIVSVDEPEVVPAPPPIPVAAVQPLVISFHNGPAVRIALGMGFLAFLCLLVVGQLALPQALILVVTDPPDPLADLTRELAGHERVLSSGTFLDSFESSMIPTLELVRIVVAAIRLPAIATGGIMDGRDIVLALKAGASAAQLGTAFLPCPESGASEVYKRAILAARQDTTVVTRAFSGRPARGLKNAFITSLDDKQSHILGYPLQNALTRSMRTAAAQQGIPDYLSLWAGQGVARARAMPAGDLVARLAEEMAS